MSRLCSIYRHAAQMSQGELAKKLKFKNGQFISNVERGMCSIPAKKANLFCEVLNIDKELFIDAYLADAKLNIKEVLNA
jgi:transcriptional regulator with XRE-family HTH domain